MWVEITEADVLTRISGPELAAIRSAVLKSGQIDPLQPVLNQVTRLVRSHVAACAKNKLGNGNTIPDELMGDALSIVVVEFMGRAGGVLIDPKGVRKEASQKAERTLERVAECKLAIEQPTTVSNEVVGSPQPSFTDRTLRFGDQDGL